MKTILIDAVYTFIDENGIIDQKLHNLIKQYPNPKIIVTNADYEKDNKYRLGEMPYEVFTMRHKPDKDDPVYFQTLFAKFNLDPTEVIYFEHSPKNIATAKALGIISHHYDPEKKDLDKLKEFLDLET